MADPEGPVMADNPAAGDFPTTHWSRVHAAGVPGTPSAHEALSELCQSYWFPLYAYIRRRVLDPDRAQELTQDLFVRFLEKGTLASADPARGRFRNFLRAVCADFLANRHDRENAQKRGGGRFVFSLDLAEAEDRYAREPAHELTAERIFDRTWALTLLGRVLERLRRESEESGRGASFAELSVALTEADGRLPYAAIAGRLGMTDGAVRVAVHRLRRRYGALLRAEIAATVSDPAEIDDEIQALFAALRP
jgi:RNA polymerase sigma-70 factor (ECF subfamily)